MYTPIEELHEHFEVSPKNKKFKMSFKEYAILFRFNEGAKPACIIDSLYLSSTTFYRCRCNIIRKFKACTFEQALLKAGKELF